MAGDLLLATHPDGRSVVQFTKTPFPFVVAQRTSQGWQAEFPTQNKKFSGRGNPPMRLGWLYLTDSLKGKLPPKSWTFERNDTNWRMENKKSGEMMEGFLNP